MKLNTVPVKPSRRKLVTRARENGIGLLVSISKIPHKPTTEGDEIKSYATANSFEIYREWRE
jgi:hypothetical protein